jgi:acyl-coenzyme A thioesterase PaaI-like protein
MDDACARFNRSPYYALLGLVATSEAPGTAKVVLPYKDSLTQLYGGVHGGALLSLADSASNVRGSFRGEQRPGEQRPGFVSRRATSGVRFAVGFVSR